MQRYAQLLENENVEEYLNPAPSSSAKRKAEEDSTLLAGSTQVANKRTQKSLPGKGLARAKLITVTRKNKPVVIARGAASGDKKTKPKGASEEAFSLEDALAALDRDTVKPRTWEARKSALGAFRRAMSEAGLTSDPPLTTEKVEAFAAWLKQKMPKSAVCYLAVCKGVWSSGAGFPLGENRYKAVLKSLQATQPVPEQERPITVKMMQELEPADPGQLVALRYVVRSFFLLARFADYNKALLERKEDEIHYSLQRGASKTGKALRLCLRCSCGWSPATASGIPICPVHCFEEEPAAAPAARTLRKDFAALLQGNGHALSEEGRKRPLFGLHSTRIGGACALAAAGATVDTILKIGLWSEKSSTLSHYLGDARLSGAIQPFVWPLPVPE